MQTMSVVFFWFIKLQENGLDLTFSMKKMLMENIKDAIYESRRHHVEAIKHRVVVSIYQGGIVYLLG